jgi:hypothetical protein
VVTVVVTVVASVCVWWHARAFSFRFLRWAQSEMSGKAPPRGPRALLGSSLPPSSPPQLSPALPKRIGAVPPTGPRSLTNGIKSPSTSSIRPHLNGHTAIAGPSSAGLPALNKVSQKVKQTEGGWTSSAAVIILFNAHP